MRLALLGFSAIAIALLLIVGSEIHADSIDFESGFSRYDSISTVTTASNAVTFSTMGLDNSQPFIAQVGSLPKDAFEKKVDGTVFGDTPEGGTPGNYFVTDGAGNSNDYLFDLENSVNEFSVDLYDFVGDGGASPSDFVTLRAYADADRTMEVATDAYMVPQPRPADGLAVTLSVSAPSIAALTLDFSVFDRGTGIDNVVFRTVPEPSTLVLMIFALLAVGGCVWYRSRQNHRAI